MLWACAPVLLWMAVIFLLGSPRGSMSETSKLIGPIIHFFWPGISLQDELIVHYYVRKTAHFTEYAILALLTVRATVSLGMASRATRLLPAIGVVLLIASLDECRQSFEPSRTSSVYDVALDLVGGITATAAAWIYLLRSKAGRPHPPAHE